mgnify:CR=1 FL=1
MYDGKEYAAAETPNNPNQFELPLPGIEPQYKKQKGDGLPGISLRAYYSKKRTRALKKWAKKKGK